MKKKTIFDLARPEVEVYRSEVEKLPLTLVLDNVRSLNNIGSIFRTADGFAVERILLCGISATPPSAEIHKTALGAEDSVEWEYYETTADAIQALRSRGDITVCCLEQVEGSVELQRFEPEYAHSYALVVGHEVNGVDQKIVDMADVCLEIPQYGTKHSLNVSVSTALAIWHFSCALRRN